MTNATNKGKSKGKTVAVDTDAGDKKKQTRHPQLVISKGLDGFDTEMEQLFPLYEHLQLFSTEVTDPTLDLLTFAHTAHYFAVLHVQLSEQAEESTGSKDTVVDDSVAAPSPVPFKEDLQPPLADIKPLSFTKKSISSGEGTWRGSSPAIPELESASTPVITSASFGEFDGANIKHIPDQAERHDWVGFNPTWDADDGNYVHERPWDQADFEPESTPGPPVHGVASSSSYIEPYNYSGDDFSLTPPRDIAGFVYLASSQQHNDYLQDGQLRIGLILAEKHRNMGYGRQAVQDALKIAFQDSHCTRVQAILVDGPYKDRALSLFIKCGLGHEGVRRRGFRSPYDFEFKDVTYLGLLATDYMHRSYALAKGKDLRNTSLDAPKSLWDELFERHQREREELLRWEEKQERLQLKRTSSMETIRQVTGSVDSGAELSGSEAESVKDEDVEMEERYTMSDASQSLWKSTLVTWTAKGKGLTSAKRRRLSRDRDGDEESLGRSQQSVVGHIADRGKAARSSTSIMQWRTHTENAPAEDLFVVSGLSLASQANTPPNMEVSRTQTGSLSVFSDDSDVEGDISDGYATSASSSWDVVETRSISSSSASSSIVDIDFDDALDIYDDSDDQGSL